MLAERTSLGRYRIIRFIGRGGMGEAYLAEDTHLRRQVAIKVIAPQADSRKLAEALRLFQREMQAIARLDHPHILPLYDYGEVQSMPQNTPIWSCRFGKMALWKRGWKNEKINTHHFPA